MAKRGGRGGKRGTARAKAGPWWAPGWLVGTWAQGGHEHVQLVSNRTRRKLVLPCLVVFVAVLLAPPPPEKFMDSLFDFDFDPIEEISKVGDTFVTQWKELANLEVPNFSFDAIYYSLMNDSAILTESKRPGLEQWEKGLRKEFPIVIVPGATTTGLEIWRGKPCAKAYFKQRLWGTMSMFSSLAGMESSCWLEHMSMNHTTGLDPEGITVRPAEGLSNVEYFMPGFGIWAQIVESLADVGYDNSHLYVHPYDWRMDASRLERRDGLLTRMKHTFESSFEVHGKPACVLTHSYGDTLARYFMSWVESPAGGKGGKGWVDKYIHRYVNIGGPVLGVPKVIAAMTSGDTSESIWLPDFKSILSQRSILSKNGRAHWFRSMSSGSLMLPQGGEEVWGSAPHKTLMCIGGKDADKYGEPNAEGCVPFTTTESIDLMYNRSGQETRQMWGADKTTWGQALLEPLPRSPNLKMYCLYGVGVETERAYRLEAKGEDLEISTVEWSDGDGTVPLVSLGYMCSKGKRGWRKNARLNPGLKIAVTSREYRHQPAALSLRGGPRTGDHVNILLNTELIGDIIAIAAGRDLEDRVISDINAVEL
ncbi:phospholipid:diacylglycerol acyltransferase [Chloropicon roscoffensis]|uniref:Phospholipid:diacylglycerol acyltransferase n=1 Tax=Chloropicon roscoffensis TaxID=1461544 RepID=A0AAX4PHY1_9CHLO